MLVSAATAVFAQNRSAGVGIFKLMDESEESERWKMCWERLWLWVMLVIGGKHIEMQRARISKWMWKRTPLPGACLITYYIFVVGTKKAAVQTQNCPHSPVLWNWERSQLLIAYRCIVNLSSVLKLQCSWYLLLVCYDLIALSDLSAVCLQHSPVCLGAN